MARTQVYIDDGHGPQLWRTDLTGRGPVCVGDEFTVRELSQFGRIKLVPGGIRRRVRVTAVNQVSLSYHVLTVEDLVEPDEGPRQGTMEF